MKPFALLDDADASAERPTSRLYTGFVREHRCVDPATLDAVCDAAQADLAAGLHAVLLADYEWGARLLRAGHARLPPGDRSCLRLLMFERLERLDAEGCATWLARQEGRSTPAPAGVLDLQPAVSREAFEAAIERIHEAIRDGETYQVNYTYRQHGHAWGAPLALYRRLRARQRVSFGALLRLPLAPGDEVEWVLSRSPELFVRHERGRLQARPMKGTAPRSGAPEGDSETARLLHEDTKNRAENLMIVDLLRNDLGRIAEIGSVKVPELFRVETYATVFQMTSTIEARRRADIGLADLLRGLFPCGSITGAPKHRTMEWIAALESGPRGLYTGAIGWLDHADARCPDLVLNVAIRTLTLGPPQRSAAPARNGLRPLTMGVGGGIVHDSVAADEYDETLWKARFLTALDPGVELFETMRATRLRGVAHRTRHRARIAESARRLGFAFDAQAFDALLDRALAQLPAALPADRPWRLRVALRFDGELVLTQATLPPLPPGPVRLLLAASPMGSVRPLAGHKTSCRADYDAGVREAEAAGAFDTLFFGGHDELLEGGRSNVFLRIGGRWLTPPLTDGVLPGVMRAVLLDDPAWDARECRLTRADLLRAEAIVVCNALRGALPATVEALQGVPG
ncbi:aminodeoxychorismate synthase component I [Piscinibacter sp. XHJ-5]|uniref:aminodeoxychorismate synthase component I n=1 Tax=Piscinibacter sp. XHJ-5 TaxID=3037797 RepID=UPI0024528C7F|nr:aminodeoxychorismate synthase component I [Piscinibacter sp. XHJ-5]